MAQVSGNVETRERNYDVEGTDTAKLTFAPPVLRSDVTVYWKGSYEDVAIPTYYWHT
jgi:hypothetical protein